MAGLVIDGDDLVVQLSRWERAGALRRDLRVPLRTVRSVSTPANAWMALRGWRSVGVGIPGTLALGTRRHGGGEDFVAIRAQRPVVQVELNDFRYQRLTVSVDDPGEAATEIATAAGIGR